MSISFVKQQSSITEPPLGGLRGNVCDSFLGRWKAPSLLPAGYKLTFSLSLTAEALRANTSKSAFVLKGGAI